MLGTQLCDHLQLGQEERAQEKEKETEWELEGSGGGNKDIWRDKSRQRWRVHMERETKRGKHRDRSKNHRRKSDFILPRNARTDMRSRRSQLTSLSLSLLLLFLPLPILCCYSPGLYVTHPLTLELKCSPPPPLLICSLHYSFITHLRSLCSASVSLFLFIP